MDQDPDANPNQQEPDPATVEDYTIRLKDVNDTPEIEPEYQRYEGAFDGQVAIDASGNDQDGDTRTFALQQGEGVIAVDGGSVTVTGGTIHTEYGDRLHFAAATVNLPHLSEDATRHYVFVAPLNGVYAVQTAQDLPESGDYYVLGQVDLPSNPYVDVDFSFSTPTDAS